MNITSVFWRGSRCPQRCKICLLAEYSLGVVNLRVPKSDNRWESVVKRRFHDDIVVEIATSLTM